MFLVRAEGKWKLGTSVLIALLIVWLSVLAIRLLFLSEWLLSVFAATPDLIFSKSVNER